MFLYRYILINRLFTIVQLGIIPVYSENLSLRQRNSPFDLEGMITIFLVLITTLLFVELFYNLLTIASMLFVLLEY